MEQLTTAEIEAALKIVVRSIENCEGQQPRFAEGTSQCTLLRNRIRALRIAESLLRGDGSICRYTSEEIIAALPPIISIRSKTNNARMKHAEGSAWYKRMTAIIAAMDTCKVLMEDELRRRT